MSNVVLIIIIIIRQHSQMLDHNAVRFKQDLPRIARTVVICGNLDDCILSWQLNMLVPTTHQYSAVDVDGVHHDKRPNTRIDCIVMQLSGTDFIMASTFECVYDIFC